MKKVPLSQRKINPADWLKRAPREEDTELVFDKPGVYTLGGKPVIIYGKLAEHHDDMLWAVKTIGVKQEVRSSNISRFGGGMGKKGKDRGLGESRVFGFRPRVPFAPAANFCSISSAAHSHPPQHLTICNFGRLLSALYSAAAPDVAERHDLMLKASTLPDWILPGTRFTSGIVNHNNPLRYHLDRGNLRDVMSCMVVFRSLCEGGYLSIPEFNARWLLEDHSYFFFDGQTFLHGVTPIRRLNKQAYRYSVVYYALRAMAKCGTLPEEISRARSEKRAREQRRV